MFKNSTTNEESISLVLPNQADLEDSLTSLRKEGWKIDKYTKIGEFIIDYSGTKDAPDANNLPSDEFIKVSKIRVKEDNKEDSNSQDDSDDNDDLEKARDSALSILGLKDQGDDESSGDE